MGTIITIGLTAYTTATYIAGWNFWMRGQGGWGSTLVFALSPITVPAALALLIVVY